uniref:Uncharacterized protein n=1 Tax=Eptatretus burgeri TaxID=7764 RepID=A0A8C4PWM2_EPTBU
MEPFEWLRIALFHSMSWPVAWLRITGVFLSIFWIFSTFVQLLAKPLSHRNDELAEHDSENSSAGLSIRGDEVPRPGHVDKEGESDSGLEDTTPTGHQSKLRLLGSSSAENGEEKEQVGAKECSEFRDDGDNLDKMKMLAQEPSCNHRSQVTHLPHEQWLPVGERSPGMPPGLGHSLSLQELFSASVPLHSPGLSSDLGPCEETSLHRLLQLWKSFSLGPLPAESYKQRRSRSVGYRTRASPQSTGPTIPQPFQMTIREAERQRWRRVQLSAGGKGSTSRIKELDFLDRDKYRRQFRAKPVPAQSQQLIYEAMCTEREERSRLGVQKRKEELMASVKLFSFVERDEMQKEERRKELRELFVLSNVSEKSSSKERKRGRSMESRSRRRSFKNEVSCSPDVRRSPDMMERKSECQAAAKTGTTRCQKSHLMFASEPTYHPRILPGMPRFTRLHRALQLDSGPRKQDMISVNIQTADGRQERTRSAKHLKACTQSFGGSVRPPSSVESFPPRINDSARLRQAAIRQRLDEQSWRAEASRVVNVQRRCRSRDVQRQVALSVHACDTHHSLSEVQPNKMHQLRQQDVQRRREYAAEMREMQKRVSGRPLLLESVTMKNAQAKAERCFLHTLRDVGLNAEFVTAMGQQENTLPTDEESAGKASELENKKRSGLTMQERERTEEDLHGDERANSLSSEDERGGTEYNNSDTDVSQQSM